MNFNTYKTFGTYKAIIITFNSRLDAMTAMEQLAAADTESRHNSHGQQHRAKNYGAKNHKKQHQASLPIQLLS